MQATRVREKSHRLPRSCYIGETTVSLTLCIEQRVPVFSDPGLVAQFVDILGATATRWSCIVPVYCFMPDHLHLVVHGDNPTSDIWKMAAGYKQRTGYWWSSHRHGTYWQKDFHDHVLRGEEDLAAHVRYVLENPCRKGLVEEGIDYPYSGAVGCSLEDVLSGLPL